MISMMQKSWTFGTCIIFADNRFSAMQAYEKLKSNEKLLDRCGTLQLATGEQVSWVNSARARDYRYSSNRIAGSR